MTSRATALFERADDCGEKIAIRYGGHALTFAELAGQVQRLSGALAALGVARGCHVGILLPSSLQFVEVEQALFMLGAAVTPINIMYVASEVAHAAICCDLEFLVTARDSDLRGLPQSCKVLLIDADADDSLRKSIPLAMCKSEPMRAPRTISATDPVFHLMTSATTGKAKGVVLTEANLASNYDRTPNWLGIGRDDVILCALPLYNTFGLNQCINAMLVTGASMVLLPHFDAGECIAAANEHGCTFLPAVPTMLQKIFSHPNATPEKLATIRLIMTGGAPVPSALLQRIKAKLPDAEVLTGYGLTEGTALVTLSPVRLTPSGEIEKGRTIGKVLDGMDLAIIGENGLLLPPGEIGEIVISGPNVMAGYYKAPDDTKVALADGWLHTGDIGMLDEDGFAYIIDRKKDVIIRGGQNIYPAEIEETLYELQEVAEVAVVARDDEMMGEVPVAYIAFSGARTLTEDELLEHCRERLARYKLPAAIAILPELPKGPTGKILRRELRGRRELAV